MGGEVFEGLASACRVSLMGGWSELSSNTAERF